MRPAEIMRNVKKIQKENNQKMARILKLRSQILHKRSRRYAHLRAETLRRASDLAGNIISKADKGCLKVVNSKS